MYRSLKHLFVLILLLYCNEILKSQTYIPTNKLKPTKAHWKCNAVCMDASWQESQCVGCVWLASHFLGDLSSDRLHAWRVCIAEEDPGRSAASSGKLDERFFRKLLAMGPFRTGTALYCCVGELQQRTVAVSARSETATCDYTN